MLSVCMIVKDEEDCLGASLKAVAGYAGEIVVVDTGSADATAETALRYTDRVFSHSWEGSFSDARNYSIEKAKYDWVLVLDADEQVTFWDTEEIERFTCDTRLQKTVGRVELINLTDEKFGVMRSAERLSRVFNRRFFHYEGSIHEQVTANGGETFSKADIPVTLEHTGYRRDVFQKKAKSARNITMLEAAIDSDGSNPYLRYQLGKSYALAGQNSLACGCYEKALELKPDHRLEYVQGLTRAYGYALIACAAYQKAMKLEKYMAYYAASPDFMFMLGHVYMNNGLFEQAQQAFKACLELHGGQAEGVTTYLPLYNIGVINECLGRLKQAAEYYVACGGYAPAAERLGVIKK